MAGIFDEQNNPLLDEHGNQIFDEFGTAPIVPVKNPTSWIPQPMGFGYVSSSGRAIMLTTNAGLALTTQVGTPLTTWIISVVGKYPSVWTATGA